MATFTLAYLLIASGVCWARGNQEFLLYVGVTAALMGVVWTVHRRVRLHSLALWGLSLWGLAHMLGGLWHVPGSWPVQGDSHVLYTLWLVPGALKFDQLVHAYGFGMTTWVCWQGLAAGLSGGGRPARPTAGLLLLAAAAGLGFGALNEVVEFAATLLVPETGVGGYVNTGWDLVANTVGAAVAVALIAAVHRLRSGAAGPTRAESGESSFSGMG